MHFILKSVLYNLHNYLPMQRTQFESHCIETSIAYKILFIQEQNAKEDIWI